MEFANQLVVYDRSMCIIRLFICVIMCHILQHVHPADTFKLTWLKSSSEKVNVNLTFKDIAWKSDREVKFKNPSGNLKDAFKDYTKPPNWPRPVYELDTENPDNNGFQNQDFIVWMRTAAFSTFRKLYRKIVHTGEFENGLPKGDYQLDINYSIHCQRISISLLT